MLLLLQASYAIGVNVLCYLDYISACRRLHEAEKTVTMLKTEKYSERDVPVQILAQRDFIKKEKEYYGEECIKWNFLLFFFGMISIFGYVFYTLANRGVA
jgi:hypothetical protein